jgi:hypothetical protein
LASGVAIGGALPEAARDDALQRRREVRPHGRHRPRLLEGDRVERVERVRARERELAGHHLVDHDPEREDVAAAVDRLAARLLRAHVAQRPEHEARLRLGERLHVRDAVGCVALLWRLEQLGEAEVEDLRVAVRRHDHVLRLDVPVNDAGLVGLLEAARDLDGDLDRAEQVELAPLDQRLHGLALDSSIAMKRPSGPSSTS